MPAKLTVLIVLFGTSALFNLVTGHWFAALINVLLTVGLAVGSEGSRVIIMGLSFLGIAIAGFGAVASLGLLGSTLGLLIFGLALVAWRRTCLPSGA